MKKVKIALWVIIFGFVGLVIFENKEFFTSTTEFVLNVYFWKTAKIWPNWYLFVAFFLVGILISYFFSLFKHYKDAKTIKMLKAKEASLVEAVSTLEKQLPQKTSPVAPSVSTAMKEGPVEVVPDTQ